MGEKTSIIRLDTLGGPPTADPCIVMLQPSGPLLGLRIPLDQPQYVIGRDFAADIYLQRDSVSRRHASIYRRGDDWFIEDLHSTNGIVLNGIRMPSGSAHQLTSGDKVRMGEVVFKFLAGDNVEAAYHEELYLLKTRDPLTGVTNRRHFFETFERECAIAERYHQPLALLMFDLDHFKHINDTYGHLVGDEVLRRITDRVRQRLRRDDLLARYGGEEFAMILSHTNLEGARIAAESLRSQLSSEPLKIDGHIIPVTASIGVACFSGEGPLDSAQLLQTADENLFRAKRQGRNLVCG